VLTVYPAESWALRVRAHEFLARAQYAVADPSVCPSYEWISEKRLKLRSCNFHYIVAPSVHPIHSMFGSRPGFSDRIVLFPIRSNPRYFGKFKWRYLTTDHLIHSTFRSS